MAEVLVLVDHAGGRLRKATAELLTIARRLGEPSAVHVGPGAEAAQKTLAKYGAHKVYVVDTPDAAAFLVAPQAEVLAALVEKV
ncbi:MAG: electron transfer flavoprotein subunit alpha/FixB family protein, partial [Dermatophilaceae bacterium]